MISNLLIKYLEGRLLIMSSVSYIWQDYAEQLTSVLEIRGNPIAITYTDEDIQPTIKKGMGAYFSSGSRPNQTPQSWSYARLASVIMGGAARKSDKKIWDKYKIK